MDELAAKFDTPLNVIGLLKGEALLGLLCRPVPNNAIPGDASVVLGGDYITSEGGTGFVHTAQATARTTTRPV